MENDNTKISLYRLKNIIIQTKYKKIISKNHYEKDILYLMNKYINSLKNINLIYTISDIESIKYGNTSYPDTLYKSQSINTLCFFGVVLGYIDSNMDYLNNLINNFKYDKNDLLFYQNLLLNYIDIRKKICINLKNNEYGMFKNFYELFYKESSYNYFSQLFDLKDNIYTSVEKLDIINAYINGYTNYKKYDLFNIYLNYIKLFNELNEFKNKNKEKFEKIKKKKKIN